MDQQQLYLDLYKEYRSKIKHQETQRSTASAVCVAFAGAIRGIAFQKDMWPQRPYLGLLLINFSFIAILMLRKLYERFALGRRRAILYLKRIDELSDRPKYGKRLFAGPLKKVWDEGQTANEKDYDFMSYVRLHHLWEALLIGSILAGLSFVVISGVSLSFDEVTKSSYFFNRFQLRQGTLLSRESKLFMASLAGPFFNL